MLQQNPNKLNPANRKGIIFHDHFGLIPGMQDWNDIRKPINIIHHISRMKYKILIIFLNIWEEQNATTFVIKQNTQQTENTEEFPQLDKGLICENPPR